MKAYRIDYNGPNITSLGLKLRNFDRGDISRVSSPESTALYVSLRYHYSPSNHHDIKVEVKETPIVKHPNVLSGLRYIDECGIIERSVGSNVQRLIVDPTPGDTRALLHIGEFNETTHELQQVPGASFPQIVDLLSPHEATAVGSCYGKHDFVPGGYYCLDGYSYLLIFKPGDAIKFSLYNIPNRGEYTLKWDGSQFRETNTPPPPPPQPTPWKEL